MTAAVVPVGRPWAVDPDYDLDLDAVTARFPALARFREQVGGTPLEEVPGPSGGARILAKSEAGNPCGSIKDRTAVALLSEVLAERTDTAGLRLVEYSGGNLAAPLAALARDLGVELTLVLSDATPAAYVERLRERDATVELVGRDQGFLGVMDRARDVAADDRDGSRTLLYQHRSQANPWFHRYVTGGELVAQLGSTSPDRFVASIGTGGTLAGMLAALRAAHPGVRGVAVTPSELPYGSARPPNGLPKYAGSGGLGHGIRQPFVHVIEDLVTEYRTVSRPGALAAMAEFRRRTGRRIGSSAAANWVAASEVAASLGPGRTVVTVFPDAGSPTEWEEIDR